MKDDEKWPLIHEYRRLASLGAFPEIKCPECDDEVIPVVDTDGSPALRCMSEGTVIHVGLNMYDQMRANIAEFKATLRPSE